GDYARHGRKLGLLNRLLNRFLNGLLNRFLTTPSLRPLKLRGPCKYRTSGKRGVASSVRGSSDTPTASVSRASHARAGWRCASVNVCVSDSASFLVLSSQFSVLSEPA